MNAQQYADYEKAVASFLERNQVKPGCHGPKYNEEEHLGQFEPFFSWQPCECCGSGLGGNRETYNFVYERADANRRGERMATLEADICVDCVYYLAYGRLDDLTMLEIEQAK